MARLGHDVRSRLENAQGSHRSENRSPAVTASAKLAASVDASERRRCGSCSARFGPERAEPHAPSPRLQYRGLALRTGTTTSPTGEAPRAGEQERIDHVAERRGRPLREARGLLGRDPALTALDRRKMPAVPRAEQARHHLLERSAPDRTSIPEPTRPAWKTCTPCLAHRDAKKVRAGHCSLQSSAPTLALKAWKRRERPRSMETAQLVIGPATSLHVTLSGFLRLALAGLLPRIARLFPADASFDEQDGGHRGEVAIDRPISSPFYRKARRSGSVDGRSSASRSIAKVPPGRSAGPRRGGLRRPRRFRGRSRDLR